MEDDVHDRRDEAPGVVRLQLGVLVVSGHTQPRLVLNRGLVEVVVWVVGGEGADILWAKRFSHPVVVGVGGQRVHVAVVVHAHGAAGGSLVYEHCNWNIYSNGN